MAVTISRFFQSVSSVFACEVFVDNVKILTLQEMEILLSTEMAQLPGEGIEKEMLSWKAVWRREALEHYLSLGWSFIKRKGDHVQGYILCQPFLFFQGWTQSLWIEHVFAEDSATGEEMIEIAYRWARDKHLQKVFFKRDLPFAPTIRFATVEDNGAFLSLSSTKLQ